MVSDSYRRYYEANRESILARMRERDAKKRDERRQFLAENPEAIENERERNRGKYHNWTANKCKRQIEHWVADPDVKDEIKAFFRLFLADEKYKTMKPKILKQMIEPLNLTASILV